MRSGEISGELWGKDEVQLKKYHEQEGDGEKNGEISQQRNQENTKGEKENTEMGRATEKWKE